jgi:DNA adenine methylase
MQPYLKWPGGKRRQQERIRAKFGQPAKLYVEPFLGAGAVFFARAAAGEFESAIIADVNPRLMACHRAVRDDVEGVIRAGESLPWGLEYRDVYYAKRDVFNQKSDFSETDPEFAALLIWINKACFNGLYRENAKGGFNSPVGRGDGWGQTARPIAPRAPEHLRACSKLLQKAELVCGDFADVIALTQDRCDGAQLYADPPYAPLTETSNFVGYSRGGFGTDEQRDLEVAMTDCFQDGAQVITSNSDTPFVRELYKDWSIDAISETRAINSVGGRRGPVGELLISRNCEV